MRKRLTAAARCAIKMRSKEPNKSQALQLLCQDLRNGPLHCFGIHTQCSTDYCTAIQRSCSSPDASSVCISSPDSSSVSISSPDPVYASISSPDSSSVNSSSPDPSFVSSSCPDLSTVSSGSPVLGSFPNLSTVSNSCDNEQSFNSTHLADDICDIAHDKATAWRDALDDDRLVDARSVAIQQPQSMDVAMYCDIQVIIGHLIAKAPQLLGKSCIQYMLHHRYILGKKSFCKT